MVELFFQFCTDIAEGVLSLKSAVQKCDYNSCIRSACSQKTLNTWGGGGGGGECGNSITAAFGWMALDAYWLSLKVALTFQCNFLTVQYFHQFQASRSNISKDLLLILSLGGSR